jgi:hypothetical protein
MPSCVGGGCTLPSGYNIVVNPVRNEQSLQAYDPKTGSVFGTGRVETTIIVGGAGISTVRIYYALNGVSCPGGISLDVTKRSGNINHPNVPLSGYLDVTLTWADFGAFNLFTRCNTTGSYVGNFGISSLWYSLIDVATPTPTATLTSTPTNTPMPTATPRNFQTCDPAAPENFHGSGFTNPKTFYGGEAVFPEESYTVADWVNGGFVENTLWNVHPDYEHWSEIGFTRGWQGQNIYAFYVAHFGLGQSYYEWKLGKSPSGHGAIHTYSIFASTDVNSVWKLKLDTDDIYSVNMLLSTSAQLSVGGEQTSENSTMNSTTSSSLKYYTGRGQTGATNWPNKQSITGCFVRPPMNWEWLIYPITGRAWSP